MQAEYIAKITGDTSGLEKAVQRANGMVKKLDEDEVLIKLNYDGNVKGFNQEFSKILKACPELTIQFQYNANQKLLDKEIDKLKQLKDLKVDVETGNADKKISDMISSLESAVKNNAGSEIIEAKIKGIYKYANSIRDLGGKIKTNLEDGIYDAVSGSKYEKSFEKLLGNIDTDKIKLFNFKKPIDEEISASEKRIEEFQRFLTELESKGASKTGLSSELDNVREEIKILRSDLSDMKAELGNISGEKFDILAEAIKEVNIQLQDALDKIATLSGKNTLDNVIKKWQTQDITKTNERYTAFNSKNMQTAGVHAAADATGVSEELIRDSIKEMAGEADGFIHSHPEKYAAFSDKDIESFFTLFSEGITKQIVTSFDQALSLDLSKINMDYKDEIMQKINTRFDEIENIEIYENNISQYLDDLYKGIEVAMSSATANKLPDDIANNFKKNYKAFLDSVGSDFTADDLFNGIESAIKSTLKESSSYGSASAELQKNIRQNLTGLTPMLLDSVNTYLKNAQQLGFQKELLSIFSDSKYLKEGVESAIQLQDVSDFIRDAEIAGNKIGDALVDGVRQGIDAHSDSQEGVKIADDFVNGIVHEIDNRIPDVEDAGTRLGEAVVGAVNTTLNENKVKITDTTFPTQQFDNTIQKDIVYLENYKNTIEEINQLKLQPQTKETERKLEELQKLADYFFGSISITRNQLGNDGGLFANDPYGTYRNRLASEGYGDYAKEIFKIGNQIKSNLDINNLSDSFVGIEEEISRIEGKSESLRQKFAKDLTESRNYVNELRNAIIDIGLENEFIDKDSVEVFNEILSKYPELAKFKDVFVSGGQAKDFLHSNEWNNFLATLPQAHTYLEALGYDFEKISQQSDESLDKASNKIIEFRQNEESLSEIDSIEEKTDEAQELYEALKSVRDMLKESSRIIEEAGDFTSEAERLQDKAIGIQSNIADIFGINVSRFADLDYEKMSDEDILKLSKSILNGEIIPDSSNIHEFNQELDILQSTLESIYGNNKNYKEKYLNIFDELRNGALSYEDALTQIVKIEEEELSQARIQSDFKLQPRMMNFEIPINDEKTLNIHRPTDEELKENLVDYSSIVDRYSISEVTEELNAQVEATRQLEEENENLRRSYQELEDHYNDSLSSLRGEEEYSHSLYSDWQEEKQKLVTEQELTAELQKQNEELKERNKALEARQQPDTSIVSEFKDEQQVVDGIANSELVALSTLREAINLVIKSVNEKTAAFEKEGAIANQVIMNEELTALDVLSGYLVGLKRDIDAVADSFKGIKLDVDMTKTDTNAVDKFVKSLSKIKDDKISDNLIKVFVQLDDFAQAVNKIKIDDKNILASINNLLNKSKELDNLASVLKESKKKIQEATKATEEKKPKQKKPKNYSEIYNEKLSSALASTEFDINKYEKEGKQKRTSEYVQKLKDLQEQLELLQEKELDFVSKDDYKELLKIIDAIKLVKKEASFAENKAANEKSVQKYLGQINELLSKNTSRKFKKTEVYQELVDLQSLLESFDTSKPQAELDELGQKVLETITKFKGLDDSVKGGGFLKNFTHRLADMNAKFFAQYFSFQDMIRYAREAFTVIQDLNAQMVELAKVSEQSLKQIENDFNSYADVAKDLGATINDTISATADWARMGYNVPDSKQLAEVALLYKNVGDGIDITSANQSLISTLQGYQMQADQAEHIVDVFNEVANNYAIDTAGIGEALQRSAASLNAANTSLEESVALVTAANTVVQNPESVGTTFKTLSARIRGAKTELQDLGEEEDEFTETTSKLQSLVKSLTGFDILEADQKTFKSIYDILIGIGKEWKNLSDIEQSSLGEALAGKRNANTLFAILDNIDTLESAYETAENAAGSARREQENFEQGLEYSINKAKAALQELAFDAVNSDFLKGLIDTGTKAIELIDKLIDEFGLLQTAIIGIGTIWGSQKLGLFDFKNGGIFGTTGLGGFIRSISNSLNPQAKIDKKGYERVISFLEGNPGLSINHLDLNSEQSSFKDMSSEAIEDIEKIGNTIEDSGKQIDALKAKVQGLGGIGSKAIGVFKSLGATLLNGVASIAISLALSAIVSILDKIINKSKYIKQAADEAKASISSMNSEFENTNKTVSEIKQRYAELSQGVGNLGTVEQNQGNLTFDEYKEFLNISNQLSELFPQLTTGYDDNGNAILNLSGDVDTVVGSLNDLVDAEKAAANQNVTDNMPKLWADYDQNIDKAKENLQDLQDKFNGIDSNSFDEQRESLITMFNDKGNVHQFGGGRDFIDEAFQRNGLSFNDYYVPDLDAFDFSDLTEDQIKSIMLSFDNIKSEYLAQVKEYEDTINQSNKEIGIYVAQAAKTIDYYDGLSEPIQKIMEGYIKSFDFNTLQDEFGGNWSAAFDSFQSTLRESFGDLSDEDKELIDKYYNQLFSPDIDVSQMDFEQIRALAQQIMAVLGGELSEFDILSALGLGDRYEKSKGQKERLASAFIKEGSTKDRLDQAKEISDFVDSLSMDELNYLETEIHIDENASLQDIRDALDKMQEVVEDTPIKAEIKASDAVDSMADAKTAITSLEELWNQTVQNTLALGKDKKYLDENGNVIKQLNDKNQAVGFADPATINSVESAFYKFSEKLKAEGNDAAANQINQVLENFEKTLTEFPGDAEKAQDAIDNLITAYIDQTDIVKNLTEENKEWSIAQLEAYGITNAEEVVMSRLNGTSKKTIELLKKLSSTVKQYSDSLDESNKGTDDYKNAISALTGDVNNALKFYDDNTGKALEITVPEVDDSFVERHLADIQAMADGDIQALQRVRMEATKEAIMKIYVHVPTDVAEAQVNQIMDMVAQADAMNIEVGASIDDAPFLSALSNMMKASNETADAVVAAFESMGYTVEWVPHPYTVTYVEAHQSDIKDSRAYNTMLKKAQQQIDVPDLRIKRTATGGGRVAHYSPSSSGGSSGGSGGGGGGGGSDNTKEPNKPKEESEESFDWIEVAIKRIEEEIARLDKVVGNSYDLWTHRNSALLKELEKTKEEIKAQRIAQSEYLRNANAVKVNNGKGLNPDDYGENDELVKAADQKLLDAAKKAWATGEYQKKVREGLMTGDDIEKIQNHFLADAVKEYQTLYEKAVAAGDAVQDLRIKLGDLAKTNFDQAKTQAEEALSYFDSYAELIDARISRTEEKGYFVSKQYYKDLLSNEKKNISALQDEYNTLIKKRNEAVAQGYIAANSEEWRFYYYHCTQ